MERLLLGFFAITFLPYGVYCLFQPGALEGIAGVAATTPTGSTELRAMYGGLQIGVGALLLFALLQAAMVRPALIALGFIGGGLLSARLIGAVLDDGWSLYTGMGFFFETLMLGGSLVCLRTRSATAA